MSEHNWNKAAVGSAVMIACGACGQSTGEIALKRRSGRNAPTYEGPSTLPFEDARCEFCHFLSQWKAQEEAEGRPISGKAGSGKVVEVAEDGTHKLIAFCPFTEAELVDNPTFNLADGTEHPWQHGVIIRCVPDPNGTGASLVEVLAPGI